MTTNQPICGPRLIALLIAMTALALPATSAMAAACTSVSVSTSSVIFGSYDPLGSSNTDSTGEITISCANTLETVPPITSITIATGRSGTFTPRNMLNSTDGLATLNYNIHTTSDRMTIWGDGTGGTSYQSLPGGSATYTETFTIYGRIPGGQSAATAGSYSDPSLAVVITY